MYQITSSLSIIHTLSANENAADSCDLCLCCEKPNMFSVLGPVEGEDDSGDVDTSAGRFVRYQFTPAFLKLCTVGAT